jgi:hypothetical protein
VATRPQLQSDVVQTPAVFTVLPDGTVLYRTYRDAEAARVQKDSRQGDQALKQQSQVKLGEQYLAKDGNAAPYSLGGLVEFQVTGLIVVLVVLISLSLICAAIGRLLSVLHTPETSPVTVTPAASTPAPPPAVTIHPGLSDQQLVVLLTAAANEMLGETVRIERFRPLNGRDQNWAAQGRHALQDHRLK